MKLEQSFYRPQFNTNHRASWVRNEFIKESADILFQNRRVLMFAYVFAYFINHNNQKLIFEENLESLRGSTEELSEILEREVNAENVDAMKEKIMNKASFCNSRRKILVDFVTDGYEKNYWNDRLEETKNNVDQKLTERATTVKKSLEREAAQRIPSLTQQTIAHNAKIRSRKRK